MLLSKARAGKSDRYLAEMRYHLERFSRGRMTRPLGAVTSVEIERWLAAQDWSEWTVRGHLLYVRGLFAWAIKRGYVTLNPAASIDVPNRIPTAPAIHTPETVRHVLTTARSHSPGLVRLLAIRYFTGLRSAEAERLTEDAINLNRGFIEVSASNAKTRQRRLVTIQPNLRAWLELGGTLPDQSHQKLIRDHLTKRHKIEWPQNVTRHSFVSYHLAEFQNAAKTALEAGHSEAMLFRHYREVVTPGQARDFWAITPA
jgi:integrase